jgi:hypothetical protein
LPERALQAALRAFLSNPFQPHGRLEWAPFFLTSFRNPAVIPSLARASEEDVARTPV